MEFTKVRIEEIEQVQDVELPLGVAQLCNLCTKLAKQQSYYRWRDVAGYRLFTCKEHTVEEEKQLVRYIIEANENSGEFNTIH